MKQITANPWETVEERYLPEEEYDGKITSLTDFGAFVELEPGLEGLVHVSQISEERVEKPTDVVEVGQSIKVKVLEINKEELKIMWNTIHKECETMGISIISGHTARYVGCNYPMVGGATVIAVGDENEYIAPTMAKPGDKVIITKGAAIEATGLFAATFPQRIKEIFGETHIYTTFC